MHTRHRSHRPAQGLRRPARRRRRLLRRRGGRDLRHPRPERRRQDHHRRVRRGPARPRRRPVRVTGLDPVAEHDAPPAESSAPSSRRANSRPNSPSARRWSCTPPSTRTRPTGGPSPSASASPTSSTTRFGKLSGGQKQRLFIALALIGNPRIVVLDELTTGLDPRARRDTWELIEDIRANGVTVLLVTHFMEEAQRLCDRIAVIDKGRIAALDTPAGLIRRSAGATVISFTPSAPLDDGDLNALPALASVEHKDGRVTLVRHRRDRQRRHHPARPQPHHGPPTPRHRRHVGRRVPRPHEGATQS